MGEQWRLRGVKLGRSRGGGAQGSAALMRYTHILTATPPATLAGPAADMQCHTRSARPSPCSPPPCPPASWRPASAQQRAQLACCSAPRHRCAGNVWPRPLSPRSKRSHLGFRLAGLLPGHHPLVVRRSCKAHSEVHRLRCRRGMQVHYLSRSTSGACMQLAAVLLCVMVAAGAAPGIVHG